MVVEPGGIALGEMISIAFSRVEATFWGLLTFHLQSRAKDDDDGDDHDDLLFIAPLTTFSAVTQLEHLLA